LHDTAGDAQNATTRLRISRQAVDSASQEDRVVRRVEQEARSSGEISIWDLLYLLFVLVGSGGVCPWERWLGGGSSLHLIGAPPPRLTGGQGGQER
jgi:hypothetical protein